MTGTGRDFVARHADGTEVPVEVGLSWLPWDGEEHAVATVADISVRTRLDHQLRRANASLEEFLDVASHDLRSPLRGIGDLLDWIREDLAAAEHPPPVSVPRDLERIAVRIARMQHLLDALLDLARAGAGGTPLEPVAVGTLVADVCELDPLPPGVRLDVDDRLGTFPAQRTPLETVLRNLLGNAVKHHDDRDRARIRVSTRADGPWAVLDVSDDGPGIPPAARDRVFRLFQTLSGDGGPVRSGVGLALVRRLTETAGGQVEVLDAEGRGVTVRVRWPRFPRKGLS